MTETPHWGSFALVSYVPDPLGSFLHGLRQKLSRDVTPEAHITILPPRPLKIPVENATIAVKKTLDAFAPFDIELEGVRRFDGTNSLYLDLGEGNALVYELHDALNTGALEHVEEFEFRPHLTLSHPKDENEWVTAQSLAENIWSSANCCRRFRLDEVVFLWLSPESAQGEWRRLWAHPLNSAKGKIPPSASAASSGQK